MSIQQTSVYQREFNIHIPKNDASPSPNQGNIMSLMSLPEVNAMSSGVIEIQILNSLERDSAQRRESAMAAVKSVLSLVELSGFIRIYVVGNPLGNVTEFGYDDHPTSEFSSNQLTTRDTVNASRKARHKNQICEQLSAREIEVLHLVANGLSRQEIADELILSINTIKTHVRNIFRKLDVNNQMNAVSKARSLGLLSHS